MIKHVVSPHMLHLLHHTLGLRPDQREPFRNYFLAGTGHHDQTDLEALESAGLMKRARTPAFCDDGDVTFVCTDAGKDYAIAHLPANPAQAKRSNYSDYIDSDSGYSFAEWLGITKPEYEVRGKWGSYEYRMFRRDRSFYQINGVVSGDWMPTKKTAKESYDCMLDSADRAGMLDGCVDLAWVTIGAALSQGADVLGAMREVARANLDKIGPDGSVMKDGNGKVIKPDGFVPPDVSQFVYTDTSKAY